MARTLTSAAQTEANKTAGAQFVRILEVQWPSGTIYYSTRPLTSPVTAEGRVIDFPSRQVSGVPGKANAQSTVTIELDDSDRSLRAKFEASPGPQNVLAYVHLYFEGTAWATDKVTEIGGILTTPMRWDSQRSIVSLTLRGFEYHFDRDIGFLLRKEDFSELACSEADGKIIPIVYGNPCRRVPATVIDRPGAAFLASELSIVPDTELTINRTAGDAGFTTGSATSLILGWGNRWEKVTGTFTNTSDTTLSFSTPLDTNRGAVLAQGTLPGFFGAGGQTYIIIPTADLPGGSGTNLGGYPLYLQLNDSAGTWVVTTITYWDISGANVIVAAKGSLNVITGSNYKIGSLASTDVKWPPGTPVYEASTWTYIVNFLPSKSVDAVEARGTFNVPGGGSRTAWLKFNPSYYSVNLNNTAYNATLGRLGTDPGVTTVTLSYAPTQLGFDSEQIWVTLKGITNDNTSTGTVLTNPADIVKNLHDNQFLGNIGSGFINAASFTAAKSNLTTQMSFALLDRKRLNDVVSDLAYQGQMLYFWDEGQANVAYVTNVLNDSTVVPALTVSNANVKRGSLKHDERAVHELTTELVSRFQIAVPAPEIRLARKSSAAQTEYGIRRDEMNLWAFQFPTSVALVTEHWLTYRLGLQRLVKFTAFLDALHLQPGDIITLNWTDGDGNSVMSAVPARVRSVRQTAANANLQRMESIEVEAEVTLFSFAIETAVPSDTDCGGISAVNGVRGTPPGKLYVRSEGVNSMYVQPDARPIIDDGGALVLDNFQIDGGDPTTDVIRVPFIPTVPVTLPPPSGGSGVFDIELGKTDADIAANASGSVSIYSGTLGSETDTSVTRTCYTRTKIRSDTWVNVIERGGGYEAFPLERNEWLLVKTSATHASGAHQSCDVFTGSHPNGSDSGDNVTCYNRGDEIASGTWCWAIPVETLGLDVGTSTHELAMMDVCP